MNDITFIILKLVVSVVAALIAYYVIPVLKAKIKEDKYAELISIIEVAVKAAEQTTKGPGAGPLKKDNVVIFIRNWMNQHGIEISSDQLDQLIEAAVFELNKGK